MQIFIQKNAKEYLTFYRNELKWSMSVPESITIRNFLIRPELISKYLGYRLWVGFKFYPEDEREEWRYVLTHKSFFGHDQPETYLTEEELLAQMEIVKHRILKWKNLT